MMPGRRVIIALWLVGLLAGCVVIVRTNFTADMSAFLPRAPSPAQQILVDQLHEGVVSRMVLLAIEGAPPDTLAALSKAIAGTLRADPAFGIVSNGDETAFGRDRDLLWHNRYLLSPAVVAGHFSPAALHAALQADVQLLGSDMGVVAKPSIPADPTGEMLRLIADFAGQAHPATRDGVWISTDASRALLMVQTVAEGFDLDAQEQALQHIDAAFAKARRAIPADMQTQAAQARLIQTGPPLFAVQTRDHMTADVKRLSMLATLLVAAILLFAYRSIRMLVLGLLPVLSGVIAGIAGVSLAFGFVHGITLGFGVTLIGEAVDYAIYLLTQTAPGAAPTATLPRIWPTLRLGMLTSVCGFSVMLLSSFTGFAQLGLFTIIGLIVALTVTRFVLPALLPRSFTTLASLVFAAPVLGLIRAGAKLRFGVLGLAIAAAMALAFHHGPYWDDELSSMSPVPAGEKSLDDQLRREIGAPDVRYLLAVQAPRSEDALVASEHVAAQLEPLVAKGAIAGFDAPSTWLPSQVTQRTRQAALPDAATLAANMAQAVDGTPFRPDIFAPFLADVAMARQQPLLRREDLNGSSLALRLDSLLVRTADHWLAMLPLRDVSDSRAIAEAVAAMHDKQLVLLDLKAESDRLLGTYLHEALTLSLAGSIAIVVLLSISLRSPRRTVAVLLPLAAAVICTAALLLTEAGRLSIFNLFGLLLVAAVGSNYCLFFERRLPDADHLARRRMVASLVIADLCTVVGFGVLSFSAIPVLHGIGLTVAIGACLSLLFGAILSVGRGRSTGWT
ncbi:MAG: MMPL family transporter [Acetobacteraceae bacterium]|jgi:predicted exporter